MDTGIHSYGYSLSFELWYCYCCFEGENLVASGVQIEAFSVEDEGEGLCFNVYIYNVQPGVVIDYATGESWEE